VTYNLAVRELPPDDRTGSQGLVTRRDALRIVAVGGAAGLASWTLSVGDGAGPRLVRRSRLLMGTVVELQVLDEDRERASSAADEALRHMGELEALLSRYRSDSEVSRLHLSGRVEAASDALLDVLELAQYVSGLGDGAFDVTVQPVLDLYRDHLERKAGLPAPEAIERSVARVDHRALRIEGRSVALGAPDMRVTLDGIGKGYIVDRAIDRLKRSGFANVLVEAGGDLVASGEKCVGTPWRIGIRNPRPGLALSARFDARSRAVATSGDYMQPFTPDFSSHHIVDPRTGYSNPELASATVVASDAATADALATLTMVLGARRGRALLEDLPDCEGYLVSKDLEVTRTSGFAVV
jgi:thiamine biosynthesis lipoprotein